MGRRSEYLSAFPQRLGWAPEVDVITGTPPQELSGTHPILTRASPRPWAPEADIGSPPQKPLGADPNIELRFPKLWAPEVHIGTPPQKLSGTHPMLTHVSPRPGHLRRTSARLLKSHGAQTRILNCASPGFGHLRWTSAHSCMPIRVPTFKSKGASTGFAMK